MANTNELDHLRFPGLEMHWRGDVGNVWGDTLQIHFLYEDVIFSVDAALVDRLEAAFEMATPGQFLLHLKGGDWLEIVRFTFRFEMTVFNAFRDPLAIAIVHYDASQSIRYFLRHRVLRGNEHD